MSDSQLFMKELLLLIIIVSKKELMSFGRLMIFYIFAPTRN